MEEKEPSLKKIKIETEIDKLSTMDIFTPFLMVGRDPWCDIVALLCQIDPLSIFSLRSVSKNTYNVMKTEEVLQTIRKYCGKWITYRKKILESKDKHMVNTLLEMDKKVVEVMGNSWPKGKPYVITSEFGLKFFWVFSKVKRHILQTHRRLLSSKRKEGKPKWDEEPPRFVQPYPYDEYSQVKDYLKFAFYQNNQKVFPNLVEFFEIVTKPISESKRFQETIRTLEIQEVGEHFAARRCNISLQGIPRLAANYGKELSLFKAFLKLPGLSYLYLQNYMNAIQKAYSCFDEPLPVLKIVGNEWKRKFEKLKIWSYFDNYLFITGERFNGNTECWKHAEHLRGLYDCYSVLRCVEKWHGGSKDKICSRHYISLFEMIGFVDYNSAPLLFKLLGPLIRLDKAASSFAYSQKMNLECSLYVRRAHNFYQWLKITPLCEMLNQPETIERISKSLPLLYQFHFPTLFFKSIAKEIQQQLQLCTQIN